MKGSIQKRLDDGVNIGALKLTGTIQQLDLGGFYIEQGEMEVYVNALGTPALEVNTEYLPSHLTMRGMDAAVVNSGKSQ
jgi:hypothetical protein